MKNKNNMVIVGSVAVIALSVAYYLLLYLPKQQELRLQEQETSLRKQTYELCLKEWNDISDSSDEFWASQVVARQITQGERIQRAMDFATQKDKFLTNCVEKRLQEYKGQ